MYCIVVVVVYIGFANRFKSKFTINRRIYFSEITESMMDTTISQSPLKLLTVKREDPLEPVNFPHDVKSISIDRYPNHHITNHYLLCRLFLLPRLLTCWPVEIIIVDFAVTINDLKTTAFYFDNETFYMINFNIRSS